MFLLVLVPGEVSDDPLTPWSRLAKLHPTYTLFGDMLAFGAVLRTEKGLFDCTRHHEKQDRRSRRSLLPFLAIKGMVT